MKFHITTTVDLEGLDTFDSEGEDLEILIRRIEGSCLERMVKHQAVPLSKRLDFWQWTTKIREQDISVAKQFMANLKIRKG